MIYEYRCPAAHIHERHRKVAEKDDPSPCPECGAETVRLIGAGNFSLSGEGWYRDGYGLRTGSVQKVTE